MKKLTNLELKQAFDNMSHEELSDHKFLSDFIFSKVGLKLNIRRLKISNSGNMDCWGGLRCKQYPDELAKLLVFLYEHKNEINSYIEIGVERGGTFFVIDSFLRSVNPNYVRGVGLDLSDKIRKHGLRAYQKKYRKVEFHQLDSSLLIPDQVFDFCLIDGDHRFEGCHRDYMTMKKFAKYIGFHDIRYPGAEVNRVWGSISDGEKYEFINEDKLFSVPLGIGVVHVSNTDDEYNNDLEIRVFGPRRIGNHAIINWIAAQAPSPVHFFNNCPRNGNPPYHTKTPRGTREGLEHIFHRHKKYKPKTAKYWDGFHRVHKEVLMYSYENFDLKALSKKEYPKDRERYLGRSKRKVDIVLLRNVFNWVASRMVCNEKTCLFPTHRLQVESKPYFTFYKGWLEDAANIRSSNYLKLDGSLALWECYAKEILGETNYCPSKIPILFDQWFIDEEYRRSIIEELGFEFTDAGKNIVAAIQNKGSSFDGLKYSQEAEKMKVLDRWKNYKGNRIFKNIFLHYSNLVEYNNRIFGENEEITEWLEQS